MKKLSAPRKKLLTLSAVMILAAGTLLSGASAESEGPVFSPGDLFTSRDLTQEADLTDAVSYTVSDGQDIQITGEGVYVLTGSASDVTVYVEAGREEKVQIVLDGVTVTNSGFPVIYAKEADKLFVTVSADSSLSVTGPFVSDGSIKTDGVLFSRCDLVLNGTAAVKISSTKNGVVSKDDLKITGGTWEISSAAKAIEANDSIAVSGGALNLTAGTDGLHAKSDDADLGYIYIGGGDIRIQAEDDGIHASSVVQLDGGSFSIRSPKGIDAPRILISGVPGSD